MADLTPPAPQSKPDSVSAPAPTGVAQPAAAAKPVTARPALTAKPTAVAKPPTGAAVTRRDFLWLGWGALATFLTSSAAATARFFFPNVIYEPSQKFNAGPADSYDVGVSTRWLNEQRVWIVRAPADDPQGSGFYAVWARCTHLGCTPNWFADQGRFRCPCHGSNFNLAGDVIAGPAPKALWRAAVELTSTGDLVVDKAVLQDLPGLRDKEPFFVRYHA